MKCVLKLLGEAKTRLQLLLDQSTTTEVQEQAWVMLTG